MTRQAPHSLPEWENLIKYALAVWTVGADDANPLVSLSAVRERMKSRNLHAAINQLLEDALLLLAERSPKYAQLLRLRFRDKELVRVVANKLSLAESSIYRMQRDALQALTEIVMEMESSARRGMIGSFESRLEPPTYFDLVGVDAHLTKLAEVLSADGPPWILAIEGMGGIGKTALADALIRRLIHQTNQYGFAWTTARQDSGIGAGLQGATAFQLSTNDIILSLVNQLWGDTTGRPSSPSEALHALEYKLKTIPHIVVIDNLETISDVETLLPALRRLARPSKFLLTSRQSLFAETDVYHYPLPPLSQKDSIALVRQEAQNENLTEIFQLPDTELAQIFEVVGGNPLALLLVVGQCHFRPLPAVLADLLEARGYRTERLYAHIYRKIWENLDDLSRDVLMAMQLTPPKGEDQDFIVGVTGLGAEDVMDRIDKLMVLNLVDCTRDKHLYRYSIHSLTRSFLHTQAMQWLNESLP
ncbi:MAG: hypothetical protein HY328_12060 [Chloroflexi bacterium]|nr:hypothetical protein [Chloroflexota bacterium]